MALKTVMGSTGKKASDLAVGESVEGYLIGLPSTKFNFAIKLLSKEGNQVETLYPNGNLNYMDAEIEDGNLALNAFTKITRTGTRQSTKSRDANGEFRQVPVFQVDQDADDVITNDAAAEALSGDKADVEGANTSGTTTGSKFANRKR